MMMFESMRESLLMGGQRSAIEGTRRGRESARKIFEMGARSGQRNARLRVKEEQGESESGKESGKV
jgi:hypothetical protein